MKKLLLSAYLAAAFALAGADFVIVDSTQGGLELEHLFFEALEAKQVELPDSLAIEVRRTAAKRAADVIGVELPAGETPQEEFASALMARYPLIVAVNEHNPVRGLSAETLRKIFTGQIKSWDQIAPQQGMIIRAGSRENTPIGRAFRKFIMKQDLASNQAPEPGHDILPGIIWYDSVRAEAGLASAPNILIYGGWELTLVPGLRILAIDKVMPTEENVASGKYKPVMNHLFLYRKDAPPEALDTVVKYFHSGALRIGAFAEKNDVKPTKTAPEEPSEAQ